MSRPSKKSRAVIDEICERLSEGEPLRQICRDAHLPSYGAVYDWIGKDTKISSRIACAREEGFEAIACDILRIADTPLMGEEIERDGERTKIRTSDMLGHRKLQIDARFKLLSKWFPAKYGDKVVAEVTSKNGQPLIDDSDVREAAQILLGGRIPSTLPK